MAISLWAHVDTLIGCAVGQESLEMVQYRFVGQGIGDRQENGHVGRLAIMERGLAGGIQRLEYSTAGLGTLYQVFNSPSRIQEHGGAEL